MGSSRALKWTILGIVVGALALCGAGGYVLYHSIIGDSDISSETLKSELSAARAEGIPLEIADAYPPPPKDDKTNAAPVYRSLAKEHFAKPPSRELSQALTALSRRTALEPDVKLVKAELARRASALTQIIEASKRPVCIFDRDWRLGAAVLFPELASIKTASKLLSAKAILAAKAGRYAESEESLRSSFRIAAHVGSEATLIALLVQIALDQITLAALQSIVLEHSGDSQALSLAERLLADNPKRPDLLRTLGGEVVMGRVILKGLKKWEDISVMETLSGSEGDESPSKARIPLPLTPALKNAWEVRLIQFYRRAFRELKKEPENWVADSNILRDLVSKEEAKKDMSHLMNRILLPVYDMAPLAIARVEANATLMSVATKLFRFREAHRGFPATLSKLGAFTDPLDNQPLRYSRTSLGFKLYSIGMDLEDNGGTKPTPGRSGTKGTDIVVEFP